MWEQATLDNLLSDSFTSANFQHLCLSLRLSLSGGLIGLGKDLCNQILAPMIQFWLPPQRSDSKFHRLFICPNTPAATPASFSTEEESLSEKVGLLEWEFNQLIF